MKPKKSLAALLVASILAILASPLHADTVYLSPGSGSFFNIFLFSQIDGISFSNEDILRYDTDTDEWSMYFDGSDVGLSYSNVNAFHLQDDSSILLSFDAPKYIAGLGAVDNSDIVRFIPSSLGTTTAGSFEWYFDGSDVGLGPLSENIDAIGFAPDGRLVISASGWLSVAGVFAQDEDLVAFEAVSLGQTTQGSWTLYVDGSDVGLNTTSEDIVGSWINVGLGDIYLTTRGSFSVNGASGTSSDIMRCVPGSLGSTSSCVYSLFWDGSAARWTRPIDGLSLEVNQPPLAQDDAFSTDEDTPITGNDVLVDNGNGPDSDPDSDPLSVSQVNGSAFTSGVAFALPSGALLSMNSNGSFDYDPNGAFEALALDQQDQDSFNYTLSDGQGGTDIATVTITIDGVDDPPVAVDDTASVTEDDLATPIDVLANDTDVDGGPKSIASITQPTNGTVVITNGGADLTYQPALDYCNDGTPTDDFTYTLAPGGAIATVSVTVSCVDDPPVAVDDTASITEDDPATTIDVLVNDTDVDGGAAKSIASVTQPASGTVVITNAGADLTYQPDPDYCNDGTPTDDFTYTLTPGSSSATVAVTVTCENDPPVAVDDAVSTDEDTVLNGDVTVANPTTADSDVDGDTLTVGEVNGNAASVGMQITLSSGALLTVNGDGMFSYDPNGQFENLAAGAMTADSFTYQICDAGGLCNTATVNITITGVNDPPVLMLPGLDPVSYPPGGTPVLLDASAELTDIDSANFNGGSFSIDITTNCDNSDLVGIQDSGTPDTDINVSGSNVSYNGTLIATFVQDTSGTPCTEPAPALLISFTDDAANASDQVTDDTAVRALVRALTFSNSSGTPPTLQRTVVITVDDGDGGTSTASASKEVLLDAAPNFVSSTPANGAVDVALASTIQVTFDEAVEAEVADFGLDCGSGPLGFSVAGSGTATVTLTPDANLPPGASCTVTLNSGINDSDAIDPPDDYSGNVASFSFTTTDVAPQVTGTQVEVAGVLTDTVTGNVDADTTIVVTFSEAVSATASAFTVDNCTVSGDVSDRFSAAGLPGNTATLTNTGAALVSGETCTLTVVAAGITDVDAIDPPDTMAANVSTTFTIDAVLSLTSATVTQESDVTVNTLPSKQIDVEPTSSLVLDFSENADGTAGWIAVSCNSTPVAVTPTTFAVQDPVTVNPATSWPAGTECVVTLSGSNTVDSDASDPPNGLDGDGDGRSEGSPTDDLVFSFGVRPNAVNDSFAVRTNTAITFNTASLLTNDTLGNPAATVVRYGNTTLGCDSTSAGTEIATDNNGLIVLNGTTFTYDPPPGVDSGASADSFCYEIENAQGDHEAQVNFNITGPTVWYINNNVTSDNRGTLLNPFTSIASFVAVNNGTDENPGPGEFIHIEETGTNYSGPLNLLNNQTVIGEGSSSNLPALVTGLAPLPLGSITLPSLGGTRPTLTNGGGDGVTLAATNTLRGFNVGNTSGAGISGSGAGTLTATECSITGTGVGINVSGKILAANFNDISSSNNSGILLNNVSGDFDVSNTVGSIINAGSNIAVNIVGNPSVDLGVTLRSVSANSTSNGMVLTNTTGSFTVIGDGTTGGTLDGLNNGSGGTISSTTGNAISLTNTGPVVIQQMLIGQAGTLGNIDGNGILADGIAALTVRNTDFINVADQNSPDEAAILVINPDAGMGVTLANNLFNRSWDDHVRIENAREGVTAGVVMGTIAITANNFDDNDASGNGNDAVLYVGENNSFATILVQSNRFHNSDGDHIQIALNGSADVESTIGGAGALANNTTSNGMNNVLGSGFTMSSGQGIGALNFNADPIFRINNNSVQDAVAAAINVNMTTTSTGAAVYHSTVNANNVGTDGDANSGGFGITLNQNGAGHLRAVMDDNQVHEYAGDYGQRLAADEGTGRLDVTGDNNLVTDATNGVNFDGIGIFAGATSTDASTTCADLTNNDWVVEAIPTEDDDYSMGGLFSGSQIILPGSGFTNEMGAAAIETFLAGQNTSTPDGLFFFLNGHLGVNDGSCNLPLP